MLSPTKNYEKQVKYYAHNLLSPSLIRERLKKDIDPLPHVKNAKYIDDIVRVLFERKVSNVLAIEPVRILLQYIEVRKEVKSQIFGDEQLGDDSIWLSSFIPYEIFHSGMKHPKYDLLRNIYEIQCLGDLYKTLKISPFSSGGELCNIGGGIIIKRLDLENVSKVLSAILQRIDKNVSSVLNTLQTPEEKDEAKDIAEVCKSTMLYKTVEALEDKPCYDELKSQVSGPHGRGKYIVSQLQPSTEVNESQDVEQATSGNITKKTCSIQ